MRIPGDVRRKTIKKIAMSSRGVLQGNLIEKFFICPYADQRTGSNKRAPVYLALHAKPAAAADQRSHRIGFGLILEKTRSMTQTNPNCMNNGSVRNTRL